MGLGKPAGYSGTPLEKKLGLKEGFIARLINQPEHYFNLFNMLPGGITFIDDQIPKKHFIHYFTTSSTNLANDLAPLINEILQDGMIWISWPKKSSGISTDCDGNIVREIGLKSGLVDIKICAIDETWSGLKFVIPLKNRNQGKS
ncbi:MAG: DUF3052 domain-containing protein [Bacteroidota bacterium]